MNSGSRHSMRGELTPPQMTSSRLEPEKLRRPKDTPFRQQKVKSWLPILQPRLVVGIFLAIGIVFIPVGKWFMDQSDKVVEYKKEYDGDNLDVEGCLVLEPNEGITCTVAFDIGRYMEPPIYVYYQLGNYYQNHRRYVKSRSANQLLGETTDTDSYCDPLRTVEGEGGEILDLNPCGLIANSMFNDIFKVKAGPAPFDGTSSSIMSEEGISWASDRRVRFNQPEGFAYIQVPSDACPSYQTPCWECLGGGGEDDFQGCRNHTDLKTGLEFRYWYPDEDKTQYLYETYPDIVSPIEGVMNEHFIVWMRTAGLPTFRKVYGRIDTVLEEGDRLEFNVTGNFFVSSFDGTKSIVLSNLSLMGARNPYLGIAYIVLGSLALAIGVAFGIKHYSNPRQLGDTRFLVWKDTSM